MASSIHVRIGTMAVLAFHASFASFAFLSTVTFAHLLTPTFQNTPHLAVPTLLQNAQSSYNSHDSHSVHNNGHQRSHQVPTLQFTAHPPTFYDYENPHRRNLNLLHEPQLPQNAPQHPPQHQHKHMPQQTQLNGISKMIRFSFLADVTTEAMTESERRALQYSSFCEGPPASGCSNGMWSDKNCKCECISPFCPDAMGQCVIPGGNCGGNPWVNCVRGDDCPWWKSTLKAESCTTGNVVPQGVWEIYPSKTHCCTQLFPYSKVCDVKTGTSAPTKYPTIEKPPEDEFEVVPIKFSLSGLPDDIKMKEFKIAMKDVLTVILAELADRVGDDLRITKIEERVVDRNRFLLRDVDLFYNVYVVRTPGRKFGPLIIQELKDAYGDVLEEIRAFTNEEYSNVNLNWCTTENGAFSICTFTESPTLAPTPRRGIQPAGGTLILAPETSSTEEGGGFPVWAVVLIVIICLLLLCCVGYFMMASVTREERHEKVLNNNIYLDEVQPKPHRKQRHHELEHRSHKSRRSERSRAESRRERNHNFEIVLAEEQPEETHTIMAGRDPSLYPALTFRSGYEGNRNAPDPSVYHDSRGRPDPDDEEVFMLTNGDEPSVGSGHWKGRGDPPLKPQRDPSMYVDDAGEEDPSVRFDHYDAEQPEGDVMRQRSMYMGADGGGEDASMQYDQYDAEQPDGDVARHTSRYMPRSDEESTQYDNYGFKQSPGGNAERMQSMYMGSATGAEYARGQRDASFYNPNTQYSVSGAPEYVRGTQDASLCEESFRTQEPESEESEQEGPSYQTERGSRKQRDASFYSNGNRDNHSYYSENVSMAGRSTKSKRSTRSKRSTGTKSRKSNRQSFRSEPAANKTSKKKKGGALHESLVSSWGEILHAAYDDESINKQKSKSFFH